LGDITHYPVGTTEPLARRLARLGETLVTKRRGKRLGKCWSASPPKCGLRFIFVRAAGVPALCDFL
jgi:hypothetical protein